MNTDFRGLWLVAGAWLAAWLAPPPPVMVAVLLAVGVLFALAARRRHDPLYSSPWFTGPLLLLTAGLAVMAAGPATAPCELPESQTGSYRVTWEFTETPRISQDHAATGRGQLLSHRDHGRSVSCPIQVYITSERPLPSGAQSYASLMRLEATGSRAGIRYWATVAGPASTVQLAEQTRSQRVKDRFSASLQGLPGSARALLPGMLYGDRSAQDDRLTQAMKATGLSHLTAVSGSNCAIVGGIVLLGVRAAGGNRLLSLLGLGVALVLFTVLVGPEPSVLRAAVMGGIAAVSLQLGRGRASLGILCLTATVLLVIRPALAAEIAFALSVLATLGIIVFTPIIAGYLQRLVPRWLAEPVALCAAAQLTCLPVVIPLSQHFSLYAIPLNLLVTAAIPLITVAGMICLCLAAAAPALAGALAWVPGIPAWGIGELALWAAEWPGAQRPWPAGAGGLVLAVALSVSLGVLLLVLAHGEGAWLRRGGSALLGAALVLLCTIVLPATLLWRPPVPQWQLAMCDVGQGDAFVIHTSPDSGWLVDTGPADGGLLGCLEQLGIQRLDKVFLTHAHEDHVGALPELLDSRIQVDELIYSVRPDAGGRGAVRVLREGETVHAGAVGLRVVGPPQAGLETASINDTSLALWVEFAVDDRTYSLFAAGDMEEATMDRLLDEHHLPPVTVLKASHHGARNGGTRLLEDLSPRLLLVSVGAGNSYGHPHPQILEQAAAVGSQVIRSDLQGTVTITFGDGQVVATRIGAPVR